MCAKKARPKKQASTGAPQKSLLAFQESKPPARKPVATSGQGGSKTSPSMKKKPVTSASMQSSQPAVSKKDVERPGLVAGDANTPASPSRSKGTLVSPTGRGKAKGAATVPVPPAGRETRRPAEDIDVVVAAHPFITHGVVDPSPVGFVPPAAPDTFTGFLLLNVEYDRQTNKALMRLYDPVSKHIYHLVDPAGHEPYCLHRLPKHILEQNKQLLDVDGFKRIETITKWDLIENKEREFSKIVGTSPLTIASGSSSVKNVLPDVLEANIRYHLNYICDERMVPGLYYSLIDGKLVMDDIPLGDDVSKDIDALMQGEKEEYKQFFTRYLQLFVSEVPDIPRVAIDLEIFQEREDRFPDPGVARDPIIAASIVSSDGRNEVLVWKGHVFHEIGPVHDDVPGNYMIKVFESEAQLIRELFRVMWRYPIVVTYNGDEFDLRYLYHRAKQRSINIDDTENPITMERGIGISTHSAFLKAGLHLDLYQFFRNRSIQGYALGGAYTEFSLDAVSHGLLGAQKFKFDGGISELSFMDLAYYNWKDSLLTLDLTRFKENLTMNLVILLMRICRMPMNEIVRTWVSAWVKQLLVWEHRARNYLVPNPEDIQTIGAPEKGLKGAFVLDPSPGVYFDVVVMDFSSLYPSIIKEYNLSYETLNCKCRECKKSPVPNTPYHVCGDRIGIMSLVTGVIRDLRVLYFKPKSKNNKFYDTLQSALKVLINASYGVYGSENFALYCYPVADSTTAIGRYSIMKTAEKAREMGATVLYGDSDSVFLRNPGTEKVALLREWSEKELHLELDVDKSYRFLALSDRKKNYLGVFAGGGVDIKGLSGKKSNTPQFIRDAFFQFTGVINTITDEADFVAKKGEIQDFIKQYWLKIKHGKLPLEAYEIKVGLQGKMVKQIMDAKEPSLKIQHLMAARDLYKLTKKPFEAGSVFSYVKVKTGAKALSLARVEEVDRSKYLELFRSTFEQVLDALGISFEEIQGVRKLDAFF